MGREGGSLSGPDSQITQPSRYARSSGLGDSKCRQSYGTLGWRAFFKRVKHFNQAPRLGRGCLSTLHSRARAILFARLIREGCMFTCGGSSSRFILTLIAAFTLFALCSHAQTEAITLRIGSINTATADPLLPRPATQPCVVPLFTMVEFANFSPKTFSYTPPACPGPWAKVVLRANFSVTAGRQFDRTANIWIGGTNVYFGTTSEPQPPLPPPGPLSATLRITRLSLPAPKA